MRKLIDVILLVKKNNFIKDIAVLTTGTVIAQVIPLLFYPILSRLFTPDDFGVLASVISLTAILGVIATGKYEFAILIAPTKDIAVILVFLIIILSFLFLSFSLFILLIFSDSISLLLNDSKLESWIFISPISAFLAVIYSIYNEWCVRNGYFKQLSLNKITNGGSNAVFKTVLGLVKVSAGGLVIGDFLGRLVTAVLCTVKARKADRDMFIIPSKKNITAIAKKYSKFPKLILPGQLLNTFNANLTTFIFLTFFSVTELGYYSMALMILILPSLVITNSVKDVFRKKANEIFLKEGNCIAVYNKTLFILAFISFFGFSVFYFIAPTMFSFVLGEQWYMAGKYAQILSPMVAISFVTEVGASMFVIAEKMKEALVWQIGYLVLTVSSLLLGYYYFGSIISMLYCLMVGRSIGQIINFLMSRRFALGG